MTQENYNVDIVNSLKNTFNPPNNIIVTNVIVDNFMNQLKDMECPIPNNLNLHSVVSRIGYKLENVIISYVRILDNSNTIYLGNDLKKEVELYKKTKEDALKNKFINEYLFSQEYVDNIEAINSIHFPDIVLVDKKNNIIKITEMKASGENDSTSVPGNINKMTPGRSNYAGAAWECNKNITVYKSISIAAAKRVETSKNIYPVRNRWENVINKTGKNIKVCVNEEIIEWLTNQKITYNDYLLNVIHTACRIEAELVKDNITTY